MLQEQERKYGSLHNDHYNCYPIDTTPPSPPPMITVDECPGMSISAANNRFKDSGSQKYHLLPFHCQLQRHYSNTVPFYHQFNYRQHISKRFGRKKNNNEDSSGSEQVDEIGNKSCGFTLAMGGEHNYVYRKGEEEEFNLDIDDDYDEEERRGDFERNITASFLYNEQYTCNL